MSYPFISCKCITYGRVKFLEESIYSFLKQDYKGKKELIIVNDYPEQTLIFDHPEVKIFNLKDTFKTIGEKENFAVEQCSGDLIAVWDDDDIALSNHLNNISKFFVNGSFLLHWQKGVFYNEPNITAITSLGNSGIVYSKKIWEEIGGHPLENAGYDTTFVDTIYKKTKSRGIVKASPPDNEVSWFYMWGGRDYHMSGMGTDTPNRKNVVERHKEHIETQKKNGNIPIGDIVLEPKWSRDYQIMLNQFLNKK